MKKGYEIAGQDGREIVKLSPEERERWENAIRPVTDGALARVKKADLPADEIMTKVQDVLDFWKLSGLK